MIWLTINLFEYNFLLWWWPKSILIERATINTLNLLAQDINDVVLWRTTSSSSHSWASFFHLDSSFYPLHFPPKYEFQIRHEKEKPYAFFFIIFCFLFIFYVMLPVIIALISGLRSQLRSTRKNTGSNQLVVIDRVRKTGNTRNDAVFYCDFNKILVFLGTMYLILFSLLSGTGPFQAMENRISLDAPVKRVGGSRSFSFRIGGISIFSRLYMGVIVCLVGEKMWVRKKK